MSNQDIVLQVKPRTVVGKQVRSLRREGTVPAVIHNHGAESTNVEAPYMELYKVYQQAGKHHPVTVQIDGKNHLTIIKETDFEPKKHELRHVVFNAIRQNEKVEAEVPLHLVGDIPAEKASLIVLTHLEAVEVEALPKNLVDSLEVDASTLAEVGDKLTVADVTVPEGVTIKSDPETVIATVEMPKDQIAEADAAAKDLAEDAAGGEAAETTAETEAPAAESEDKKEE